MLPLAPHACTDITGFGLLGHVLELAKGSGKTVEIFANAAPLMPQALDFAREGIIPAGAYSNMEHTLQDIEIATDVPQELADILFDPQTSGGLLIAIAEAKGKELLQRLTERGETAARDDCGLTFQKTHDRPFARCAIDTLYRYGVGRCGQSPHSRLE